MSELRALLLTDVVDSTRLSERLGDLAMADVWATHDRVARDLLPAWRGREIDKTDGMLLMFNAAADAVNYALAYHRALAALPVPLLARAGLHVGSVILRENSADDVARGAKPLEVEGLAKPTAARVMAVAQGGQTLLTEDAQRALGAIDLPMKSQGHWVLKGLADPIELFEVAQSAEHFATPADGEKAYRVVRRDDLWLPVREVANNLPLQATSFVGREREQGEVRALVGQARLVTLLGMGGLGKTRLSLQVATSLMAEFPDGVWFLDLAPIRDPALVVSEAAQVIELREEPGRGLLQTLCAALKPRRCLLVFDNCEHLVKASADLANAILRAAPRVRILASSREALRVPGEQAYPVAPLPLPERGGNLEALERSSAVRLFVDRARSHKPAFRLTERDVPVVAELVARLEGIPLALELAAARVRAMSLADINARLKHRYKLLTGGSHVLMERQQTLRALVDWSYDLLEQSEQIVLNRLAVFAGGFDLEAAEAVCGAEPVSPQDVQGLLSSLVDKALVLDMITSLVEKSLVTVDELPDGTRYRLLETIRDYAREKLEARGDLGPTAERHCLHYFNVAKRIRDGLKGAQQAESMRRGEEDLDNIRAAIALALRSGADSLIALKYAVALTVFWMLRGYAAEGRSIAHAASQLPAVRASEMARAHAAFVEATLASSQGDQGEARRLFEDCLALRRGLANPLDIAATLSALALARLQAGGAQDARELEREALAIFREQGERRGEAISLLHLGQIAVYLGDDGQALADLRGCLRIAHEIESPEIEGEVELTLGVVEFEADQLDAARSHLERSLAICREAGDRHGQAHALGWLGKTDLAQGGLASAAIRLAEALGNYRDCEMRGELIECLEDQVELAGALGAPQVGAQLAGFADDYRGRLGLARSARSELRWQRRMRALRGQLAEAEFIKAWDRGRTTELMQVISAAQALAGRVALPG